MPFNHLPILTFTTYHYSLILCALCVLCGYFSYCLSIFSPRSLRLNIFVKIRVNSWLIFFVPQWLCGHESIMQYKPNLPENQVNANSVLAKGYKADIVFWPKNPKANFRKSQMSANLYDTTDYENISDWTLGKNKPNSNPIQSQFKANQSQYKPNSNPIKPNFPQNHNRNLSPRESEIGNRKSQIPSAPLSLFTFALRTSSFALLPSGLKPGNQDSARLGHRRWIISLTPPGSYR